MSRTKDFPRMQAAFRAACIPSYWAVEPLSGYTELARIKLFAPPGCHELTCLERELDVAIDWARRTSAGETRPPLLVDEYWQRPWTDAYRWTLDAWRRAEELVAERRGAA